MKNKKIFFGIFLLGVFLVSFSFNASAQIMGMPPGNLSEEEKIEMKEEFESMSEEEKIEMKEKMGGRGEKFKKGDSTGGEVKAQRLVSQRKVFQVKENFEGRLDKFDQIVDKVNELILKLKENGIDTLNLEEKLIEERDRESEILKQQERPDQISQEEKKEIISEFDELVNSIEVEEDFDE